MTAEELASRVEGTELEGDHIFGNVEAAVTVIEYGDFECPYCAGVAPILRELVEFSDGRVRLIFRNFPLFEVHPHSLTASLAAEAAATAGVFWPMHDLLFKHQSRLEEKYLRHYAGLAGADPELATGAAAEQFAPKVRADYASGLDAGVEATPGLFVNGAKYDGRLELTSLQRAAGLVSTARFSSRRRPG
jgi:protein-disulfide isomerase